MTTNEQAVVQDTNAQVTPDAAVENAQNEEINLDALLNEWEPKTDGEQQSANEQVNPNKEGVADETKEILEFVKQQRLEKQEKEQERIAEEYKNTVKSLRGDLPVSEKFVDGFLRIRAAEDPRILSAYQNRFKAPDKWSKIEKGLQNEIRSELKSLPDNGATDTRRQIANAIQSSQSNSSYESEKPLKDMTDQEFYDYQQRFIGQ